MSFEQYEETVQINYLTYVHLTKLFMAQSPKPLSIVNMVSVAGMQGMTAIRNTDYSACKAAIASYSDSLRQEFMDEGIKTNICNIYPYIINTTLFQDFSGTALWLIPMLKQEQVAERIYWALVRGEMEVYIPSITYWMGVGMMIVRGFSEKGRIFLIQFLMGNGMKTINKRKND